MVVFWSSNLEVPGSNPAISKFFSDISFSGCVWVQIPLEIRSFFSYVESNNLYHLCVFGLVTDLYLVTKVSDNLDAFKSSVEQCEAVFKKHFDLGTL